MTILDPIHTPIHIVACDEASSNLQEQTQDPQEPVLHEPISLQISLQDPNSEKWIEAINEEYKSM